MAEDPWPRTGPSPDRGDGAPLGRTSMCALGVVAHPCATRPIPPTGRRPSVHRWNAFVCEGKGARAPRIPFADVLHPCRSRSCRRPRCRLRPRDTPHHTAVDGTTGSYTKGQDIDAPKTWTCGCVVAAAMDGRGSECAHGCAPEWSRHT